MTTTEPHGIRTFRVPLSLIEAVEGLPPDVRVLSAVVDGRELVIAASSASFPVPAGRVCEPCATWDGNTA